MKLLYFSVVLFFCTFTTWAQSATVSGKVLDENQNPISFATVVLYGSSQNNMIQGAVTKDDGSFFLDKIEVNTYYLQVSFIGYDDFKSPEFTIAPNENKTFNNLQLSNNSTVLKDVTIVGKRPIIEVKADKTTFNVDGSVNAAGNDGLELLRKAPGVVVDNNNNIYLAGKSGVRIFINGKPSPLSGDDLAAFLKTINSADIDKIDIISNPSAKYDAEGNAGIIDIRFKKDARYGANGSLNAGFHQGKYRKYNGGISANYRNKKLNTYASASLDQGNDWWFMNSYRRQNDSYFSLDNDSKTEVNSLNLKLGSDYFVNDKNTIGFIVDANLGKQNQTTQSTTLIGALNNVDVIGSTLISNNSSNNQRDNLNVNLNYVFDNKKDITWNIDADYGIFKREAAQIQPNLYVLADGSTYNDDNLLITPNNININSFKIDHQRPLGKGKLGVGIKTALVLTDNTFEFYKTFSNLNVFQDSLSSVFNYSENVNAAYTNYDYKKNKWGFQAGLRLEQTNSQGTLEALVSTANDDVKRSYINLFPSAGVSYQLNPTNSFNLTYRAGIDRPSYDNLNPFVTKISDVSSFSGNPFLNPEFGHSFSLAHTFKYKYTTTYGYTYTKDFMGMVSKKDPTNINGTTLTWLNLDWQQVHNIALSIPQEITNWWSSYTNAAVNYLRNYAAQDNERGISGKIDISSSFFSAYSQHTFSLPWELKFEVSGWFNSGGVWQGIFKTQPMGSLDLGVQRKFLDGKANLKLSFNDVLRTSRWSGSDSFDGISSTANGGWDSQRFRANFTYMFGNQNVKSRKRTIGAEQEGKRTGGGGGGRQ